MPPILPSPSDITTDRLPGFKKFIGAAIIIVPVCVVLLGWKAQIDAHGDAIKKLETGDKERNDKDEAFRSDTTNRLTRLEVLLEGLTKKGK